MFDRISDKLKRIAKILFKISFIIGAIICIAALDLLNETYGASIALVIVAAIVVGISYVSCALIYGFAELIEKTTSTNLHIANINANAIPKLVVNTNKETPECTENKAE